MLPFKKIPRIMIVKLVETVKFYVNGSVLKSGVLQHLSPMNIVEGVTLDYNKHFQVIFGEYAQVFKGTDNTMKERTVGAKAVGPTGNLQGGVSFLSIHTGRILDQGKKDYQLLKMPHVRSDGIYTRCFTKCNKMDRRWKIIIFLTHLFNARKASLSSGVPYLCGIDFPNGG
jgi:hypothetical protein